RLRYNQPALAERSFGDAYRLDGQLPNALAFRAISRMRQNKLGAAEADLTAALAEQPDKVAYRLLRAQVRRKLGKQQAATEDEDAGLGREPDDELSYAVRGRHRLCHNMTDVLFRTAQVEGSLKLAISDLDHALAINPRNPSTLRNKAAALE